MKYKTNNRHHFIKGLLVLLLMSGSPIETKAADEQFGKTILARGSVTADRSSAREPLKRLSPVFRQDILRSGNNARGQFRMIDDALINLQQNSVLRLEKYELKSPEGDGSVLMELISGGLRTITGAIGKKDKKDYQLRTPVATIGIRGTLYEVEIVREGVYAAAWQGNIFIRSYTNRCNLELGDDFEKRFVFIDRQGVCRVLDVVPEVFREGHSSDVDTPLPATNFTVDSSPENPQGRLPFRGLAVGLSGNALEKGQASSFTTNTPVISISSGVVSLSSSGSITDFQQIAGYDVSWGRWTDYDLNPALDGLGNRPLIGTNDLLWTTYQPSEIGVVNNASGQVRYDNMIDSLSLSSTGQVNNLAVQMDVDFAIGSVTNGAISAQVPNHTWVGVFDGQVSGGQLNLNFNGGARINALTGAFTSASGDIKGDFIGNNAQAVAGIGPEAIIGGFNMIDDANNANQIEGVFLVGQ